MKLTDQQKHDQLKAAGLLDSTFTQLTRYYGQLLRLDFGTSRRIQSGVSVVKVIGGKFAMSMQLGLISFAISLVIGVVMGVLKLPSMYSTRNPGPSMILPVACLSLSSIAGYALWTRRYMVDELNKDYIKLARVKGLSSKRIMVTHVLRNAFVPLAQYIPYSILLTVGGSLLVERFFSVPGMGSLLTDAINRYDTNVVQTLVILYAALGIIGVFLGDILMMIIDPRITLTGKGGTR